MRSVRRLVAVAIFVAALVLGWRFAHANLEPVRVDYLVGVIDEIPLWSALVGAFAAGAVLVGLAALVPLARTALTTRRWRKVAHGLEAELHQRLRPRRRPRSEARRARRWPERRAPSPGVIDPGGGLVEPKAEVRSHSAGP